jgi:hypothetical protein
MLNELRRSFLTAPVFVRRAYAALEALDGAKYRSRSAKAGVKELVEEIIPLAALLKHMESRVGIYVAGFWVAITPTTQKSKFLAPTSLMVPGSLITSWRSLRQFHLTTISSARHSQDTDLSSEELTSPANVLRSKAAMKLSAVLKLRMEKRRCTTRFHGSRSA